MWRQPKAVWAVAFASVVAFMGIGLVDPILKPIADNLNATPSQVSLLFTSYMAVMGLAMLITGVNIAAGLVIAQRTAEGEANQTEEGGFQATPSGHVSPGQTREQGTGSSRSQ